MKLHATWRASLKWWSNRIILIAGALPIAWLFLPSEWQDVVVNAYDGKLVLGASGLALAAFIARNIQQKSLEDKVDEYADTRTDGSTHL